MLQELISELNLSNASVNCPDVKERAPTDTVKLEGILKKDKDGNVIKRATSPGGQC